MRLRADVAQAQQRVLRRVGARSKESNSRCTDTCCRDTASVIPACGRNGEKSMFGFGWFDGRVQRRKRQRKGLHVRRAVRRADERGGEQRRRRDWCSSDRRAAAAHRSRWCCPESRNRRFHSRRGCWSSRAADNLAQNPSVSTANSQPKRGEKRLRCGTSVFGTPGSRRIDQDWQERSERPCDCWPRTNVGIWLYFSDQYCIRSQRTP